MAQGRRMLTVKGLKGGEKALPSSYSMSAAAFGRASEVHFNAASVFPSNLVATRSSSTFCRRSRFFRAVAMKMATSAATGFRMLTFLRYLALSECRENAKSKPRSQRKKTLCSVHSV